MRKALCKIEQEINLGTYGLEFNVIVAEDGAGDLVAAMIRNKAFITATDKSEKFGILYIKFEMGLLESIRFRKWVIKNQMLLSRRRITSCSAWTSINTAFTPLIAVG